MTTQKELKAISRATPEARRLWMAIREKGFDAKIDFWDGHKHIDIAIPEAKINIEVDGIQHNTKPEQALADLKRTYYSFKWGYLTFRIPNSLIHNNFNDCLELCIEMIKDNKQRQEKSK